ncbi:uncharacterized protein TNCV_1069901 [Trichonephila clavipes]|nr:uncharacterized protein TNCV_1069901 [Trichonephila clavipes]
MRARAYCAHPSIRDIWALRYMSRCLDQVVSLKRDPQCLSPQESLVLIYRPTAVGMKGIPGTTVTFPGLEKTEKSETLESMIRNLQAEGAPICVRKNS